ncbi:SRF-type transcription factor (DNA-binding and dimerization domain)-domain-containing protein [Globomyces pollinis-pini]|nr:SRF-type transcription factor (DNA-binding and dimerization domain)-domain-containing protein [Globomyces pollinis-pini]
MTTSYGDSQYSQQSNSYVPSQQQRKPYGGGTLQPVKSPLNANKRDARTAGLELDTFAADEDDDEKEKIGRRKIKIEYIEDKSRRHITFSKRKAGIMKKAYELSTLTGTQVLLLVASETGHVYTFATPKLQPLITKPEGKNMIQACLNAGDTPALDSMQHPQAQSSSSTPANQMPQMTYPQYQPTPIHSPAPRPSSAMSVPYSESMDSPHSRILPDPSDMLLNNYIPNNMNSQYQNSYNSAGLPISPSQIYNVYPNNYQISQNPQYSHLVNNNGRSSPQLPGQPPLIQRTSSPMVPPHLQHQQHVSEDLYDHQNDNAQHNS